MFKKKNVATSLGIIPKWKNPYWQFVSFTDILKEACISQHQLKTTCHYKLWCCNGASKRTYFQEKHTEKSTTLSPMMFTYLLLLQRSSVKVNHFQELSISRISSQDKHVKPGGMSEEIPLYFCWSLTNHLVCLQLLLTNMYMV